MSAPRTAPTIDRMGGEDATASPPVSPVEQKVNPGTLGNRPQLGEFSPKTLDAFFA